MRRRVVTSLTAAFLLAAALVAPGSATAAPRQGCELPADGASFTSASPAEEAMDPAAVNAAIAYAQTHLRASVQIFRDNCRIGRGLLDPVTDQVPMEIFSSTKSVISILTGIAYDQHLIGLDDPIGKYLPAGVGDAAHRAITIRNLLTQTSGLDESILAELASVGLDPDLVQEAMAQPLTHEPGTHFEYSQRTPDLLSAVLQRAVGEDLQTFAQRELFDPVGIPRGSYLWLRDQAGNSYGYANLFIPPAQFAKLGLLMQNDGVWRGHRVLSTNYITQARANTPTNQCYGFLFWHNGGSSCTSANFPHAQTVAGPMIGSAPADTFAMVGALQQNNFMIPSLGITVTWTGVLGDTAPNLAGLLSASPSGSNLYYDFFRILLRGVQDTPVPDPGPFRTPPLDLDINPVNYLDPVVLLRDLAPNAHCNVLICRHAD
ncbi:serine hydrolase [Amycolatopsis rhabdoformis]|uniref:Serine hydrolase n=1 Tax=Amycolatopsis rhabdoformis TaxID=1448059 RepID=A0ABZ1I0Y9_9PSEU|nr:serine hydrolase [Amycolatopsis rhabdoformis]WSE28048.1 serine hydrolase [Amycolatopsis rhabdoformis]